MSSSGWREKAEQIERVLAHHGLHSNLGHLPCVRQTGQREQEKKTR